MLRLFAAIRCLTIFAAMAFCVHAQSLTREITAPANAEIVIINRNGRVTIKTDANAKIATLTAETQGRAVNPAEVLTEGKGNTFQITTKPAKERDRIDLTLTLAPRARVRVTTGAGAVELLGDFSNAQATTDTGTIHADALLDEEHGVKLEWLWQTSRPRFFSEEKLPEVKEKRAGMFLLKGIIGAEKPEKDKLTELNFVTQRGVILFNVDPARCPPICANAP